MQGEVWVYPDEHGALLPPSAKRLRVVAANSEPRILDIEALRTTPAGLLISFVDVRDRDSAQTLVNGQIEVPAESLSPLAEGEFYLYELEGSRVQDAQGLVVGVARGFLETRAGDVLVIEAPDGERLMPLAPEMIVRFDRAERCLFVRVPAGMWDAL